MRPEGEAAPLPAKPGAVSPPLRCEQLSLCEVTRGKVQAGPYQKVGEPIPGSLEVPDQTGVDGLCPKLST